MIDTFPKAATSALPTSHSYCFSVPGGGAYHCQHCWNIFLENPQRKSSLEAKYKFKSMITARPCLHSQAQLKAGAGGISLVVPQEHSPNVPKIFISLF